MNVIKLESIEEVQSVYDWNQLHKDAVRRGIFPMNEVKIVVEIKPEPFMIKASKVNEEISFRLFAKGERFAKFIVNLVPGGYVVKESDFPESIGRIYEQGLVQDFSTLYFALMALLVESPKQKDEKSEPSKIKLQKIHEGKRSKKNKGYCYIVTRNYSESSNSNGEKRQYTKCTDAFEVRGHYRHYKSGKVVWIKPYTKNEGKSKKDKVYKLGKLSEI